jgi:hypothetical protein
MIKVITDHFRRKNTIPILEPVKVFNVEERKQTALELMSDVNKALQRNTRYNKTSDGRTLEVVRPRTKNFLNNNNYSFVVFHPEDEFLNGQGIVMQIDVGASTLHLHEGPYGKDTYKSIEELSVFRAILIEKAEKISRFA